MRVPRDLSGADLADSLARLGYRVTRQTGSHLRLTTSELGEHHVTVPAHKTIPLGTLRSILKQIAGHFGITTEEVTSRLFAD
jgi:predicted RNA binding protein YcfA (HicA-like mRNA interferase family)